jgi:hypothetical protein
MDFVMANTASKLTKVQAAIRMYTASDYKPADYYLDMKHAITACFAGQGVAALDNCITHLEDVRKHPNYSAIRDGLRTWIGRKRFGTPFAVPEKDWATGELIVRVHPELGLVLNDERLVIKVYLKDEPLTQRQINPLLYLLDTTHGSFGTVAILDARRGKLFKITQRRKGVEALLASEAHSFVMLWNSLAA